MTEVGYSGTPLIKKLGIKPEMKVLLIHEPDDYFNLLGQNIPDQLVLKNEVPHLIHLFAKDIAVFKREMKVVLRFCKKNPAITVWISWYKKVLVFIQICLKISFVNLPYRITW